MRRDQAVSYPNAGDLEMVNKAVNAFPYGSDPELFGKADDWTPADERGGDCESYAMAKFGRLYRLFWPPLDLRLACCYVEPLAPRRESDLTTEELVWLHAGTFTMAQIEKRRRYHGVLVVTLPDGTERGLDNRYPYPMPLAQLKDIGYEPDIIQIAIWPRAVNDWEPWRWA